MANVDQEHKTDTSDTLLKGMDDEAIAQLLQEVDEYRTQLAANKAASLETPAVRVKKPRAQGIDVDR